jgi:ABC-type phosphate transport system substrate-binding protein
MFCRNANLAQALSVTAALAAVLAAMPSAQAQVPTNAVPAVSADPLAVLSSTPVAFPNFAVSPVAQQFFGLGASLPSLLEFNLFKYVGVAAPKGPSVISNGLQLTSPAGSPRLPNAQFNYVGTGSGNGRGVFIGSAAVPGASAPVSANYTPSTSGAVCAPNVPGVAANPPAQSPLFCQGTPTVYPPSSVSFAGTEVPLNAAEIATYNTNQAPTRGPAIQVPIAYGSVAVAYNQTGGPTGTFNLATADLCRIFDGTFSSYSQLSAASSTGGATGPIVVEIFSDSSGTTNGFTSFLANACPSAIGGPYFLTAGVNTFPTGTPVGTGPNYFNFIRSAGDANVTNAIGSTVGALGYVGASFTSLFQAPIVDIPNPPTAARLQVGGTGAFVPPLTANVRAAIASGLTLNLVAGETKVYTVGGLVSSIPSVIPTAANAYPITVPTYILLYSNYSQATSPNVVAALKGLFGNAFLLGNRTTPIGPNDQLAQQLGLSLPSNPFRTTSRNAISTITQVP